MFNNILLRLLGILNTIIVGTTIQWEVSEVSFIIELLETLLVLVRHVHVSSKYLSGDVCFVLM